MKKLFSLLLCLLMMAQMLAISAAATETAEPTQEPTEMPTMAVEIMNAGSDYENSMTTILSGCRTLDAQVPLGGDARMLKSAMSAFVYERNTGTLIYSYNPDLKVQPGTLTKIVAAIVAIENGDLDKQVTVSSRNYKYLPPQAKNAKLKEGEILTLRDLLYCMFLEWANDAAVTIAENVCPDQESFVKKMNEWVKRAGCTNTQFADCHGLGSENQSTTARDMARIVETVKTFWKD